MVIVTEITEETEECYCDEESEIQSHLCERFCKFPCLPFETNIPGKFGITALFIYHLGKLIFQTQKINFACWAKKLKLNWNPWPRAKIEISSTIFNWRWHFLSTTLSLSLPQGHYPMPSFVLCVLQSNKSCTRQHFIQNDIILLLTCVLETPHRQTLNCKYTYRSTAQLVSFIQ